MSEPSSDELSFTGERLHEADPLFGVDLLRHRAAYQEALRVAQVAGAERILELGSGTGYGAAELAETLPQIIALDRVRPLAHARRSAARFVRGDLNALPSAAQNSTWF